MWDRTRSNGLVALAMLATAVALACRGSDRVTSPLPQGTPSKPVAPSPPKASPPVVGPPHHVELFGLGFSFVAGGSRIGPPSGVIVFDSQRYPIGYGVPVRFDVVQGLALIDTADVVTNEIGVATFRTLHVPNAPAVSVLRVSVKGTPMREFRFESVVPETRPVTGTFALTAIDDLPLPVPYPETATEADSLVAATLTFEPTRYQLAITVRRDGTLSSTVVTGQVDRYEDSVSNCSLRPDYLPAGTYFDRNPCFLAADGRLQVLNASDEGWPLTGGRAEFLRRP